MPIELRETKASYGWSSLGSLGVFVGALYGGLAIVLLVVYPVLLKLHGLSPLLFYVGAWPAIQLTTCSSRWSPWSARRPPPGSPVRS